MKKILAAVITMIVILAVRTILSITFHEQIAEVFCRTSIGILFFYYVLLAGTLAKKAKSTD